MTSSGSSRHDWAAKTYRPEPGEHAKAKAVLTAQGRTMEGFIRACLRLLGSNPAQALEVLDPYWPPEKRRGRPRTKNPSPSE